METSHILCILNSQGSLKALDEPRNQAFLRCVSMAESDGPEDPGAPVCPEELLALALAGCMPT